MTAWAEADDTDLLSLVRDGHTDAMAELWSRHYPATLTAARRVSRQPQDAEEFASEAFSGMLHAISNDAGPSVSVRGYLLAAVRNQAANRARRASANDVLTDEMTDFESADRVLHDPVAHHAELGLVRQAFATLPPRWQIVLWRTAVDHDKPAVIAADLDRSPNAVAALARRARQGFRVAYLRAHESTHGIAAECAPYASRLVELLPDADTVATAEVREHVAQCPRCARRLADLRIVDADLGGALLPALLTLGPGIAWATGAHAASHAAGGAFWLKWWHGPDRTRTLTIAGTAAGVIIAGTCAAFALTNTGSTPPHEAAGPPTAQSAPAGGAAATSSTQPSSTDAPASTDSSSVVSTSRTSATATGPSRSSSAHLTSTTSSAATASTADQPPRATSSPGSDPTSTRPGTSTAPVPRTSTVTGTSTAPVTRTPTHTSTHPGKPKPSPSHTRPPAPTPQPTPTTTKPPVCWPIFCWPWG